jgi:ABC-type branched-subunit amino acid transport system substrate-binding protein
MNLIRPYYSFGIEGEAMVQIVSEDKPNKVGIIYSRDSSSSFEVEKVVIPGLEKLGVPMVVESFVPNKREFRDQVTVIKAADPDQLLLFGFGPDLSALVKTLKEQGLYEKTKIVGSVAIGEAIIAEGDTKAYAGIYYFEPTFYHDGYENENAAYADFKRRYIERYGEKQFQHSSVFAYDAYLVVAKALMREKTKDASTLMDSIRRNPTAGLAGVYVFDENGDTKLPVGLVHVSPEGELKLVRTF